MGPKKKEKTGKGTLSGTAMVDEPPQPQPDERFCLMLVIDVSLDISGIPPPDVGAEGSSEIHAHTNDSLPQDHRAFLVDPVFRYTFINGEKIITPPVGKPGSSWTIVSETPKGGSESTEEVVSSTGGQASGTEADRTRNSDDGESSPPIWRYKRVHKLKGTSDEEVALKLDKKPFMQVTLADASTHGATAQPPGPGLGRGGSSRDPDTPDRKPTTMTGRNFIESWPLDLSAFLAGESSVDVFVGRNSNGDNSDGARAKRGKNSPGENTTTTAIAVQNPPMDLFEGNKVDWAPAPEGIRYMRLSVSACRPGIAMGGVEEPLSGETTPGIDAPSRVPVEASRNNANLLSAEAMESLNPLSITITSAMSLPGVRIEAPSLQHHVQPSVFSLLETHCKPVYVVCRPFPDTPSGIPLHPRAMWTAGSTQRDRARFSHTSAFLVGGSMDRHRLEEWAETCSLRFEVHDRDPTPSEKEKSEKVLRLERMVAGGYPVEKKASGPAAGDEDDDRREAAQGEGSRGDGDEMADEPITKYGEPRDIFDVDALVLHETMISVCTAGKDYAHGVAQFRLSGLLDQSKQLVDAYTRGTKEGTTSSRPQEAMTPAALLAPKLRMRSEILPCKRREIPRGGVEDWHLSDGERFVRWPGAYLDAGSTLGIRLALSKPLRTLAEGTAEGTGPSTEEPRPFTRIVFVVEYEGGGQLVHGLATAMDEVNGRALGNVQGSLRSYRLTAEEREAVDDGRLDVICGFTIIDEDSRTIVLEGLAGPRNGLETIFRRLGRTGPNSQAYRVLENPQVRFANRLYTSFDADLKKVRLRDALPILCRNPEVYDRSKVSVDCFDALQSLRSLRKVGRLREAAQLELFPSAAQLVQVESKYGESISIKDITGHEVVKERCGRGPIDGVMSADAGRAEGRREHLSEVTRAPAKTIDDAVEELSKGEPPSRTVRKAHTDTKNAPFEEWLRSRRVRDFLAEQAEVSAMTAQEVQERRRKREQELQNETVRTDWCYGQQKLNYVELKKAEMRDRLATAKGAVYTYSMDYVSQSVSLVDETRLQEDQEAKNRAAWKTRRGFVWPCPRTRQELITHPKKPSQSRIDALREPWVENELTGGGIECNALPDASGSSRHGPPPNLASRPAFDTVPSNGKVVFGGLQAPKYDHDLDTALIGSRSRLPRGLQKLERDPEFFRSVHLGGDGLAKEKDEEKAKAERLWRSKVVVDDINFRVGNFSVRDTPLQTDRFKDILHAPVKKKAFKIVRNARLPSGKVSRLRPPAISVFSSSEPFAEPQKSTAITRSSHPDRWVGQDPSSGSKLNFHLYLHSDRMKPKSHKIFARRRHLPLTKSEMCGARWETRNVGADRNFSKERDDDL